MPIGELMSPDHRENEDPLPSTEIASSPSVLIRIGQLYLGRYNRNANVKFLTESRYCGRQAIEYSEKGSELTAAAFDLYAAILETYFERFGILEDLEEAIVLAGQALNITPKDSSGLLARLNSVGNKLGHRFERLGKLDDLEEAIRLTRRAIDITSEDNDGLAKWM